jgi:hypothetical protein
MGRKLLAYEERGVWILGGIAVTFRWVDRGMVGMVGRRARDWLGGQVGMDAERLTLGTMLCSAR